MSVFQLSSVLPSWKQETRILSAAALVDIKYANNLSLIMWNDYFRSQMEMQVSFDRWAVRFAPERTVEMLVLYMFCIYF